MKIPKIVEKIRSLTKLFLLIVFFPLEPLNVVMLDHGFFGVRREKCKMIDY